MIVRDFLGIELAASRPRSSASMDLVRVLLTGKSVLQRLTAVENMVLGVTTGIMSKLVNYPLLNFKNTVQQGRSISLNPSVVYRGLAMACLNLGGTTGVQFWSVGAKSPLSKMKGLTEAARRNVPKVARIRQGQAHKGR